MLLHPPAPHPTVVQLARPTHGTHAHKVNSHGFTYQVTGNTLFSSHRIKHILNAAKNPRDALSTLDNAYHQAGYFLVAVTARVNDHQVHIMVIQGQIAEKKVASGLQWFYGGLSGDDVTAPQFIRRNILASAYAHRNGNQLITGFEPSPNPEGSILNVQQHPQPDYFPLNGSLTFGNYGSRYTSNYITGANLSLNPGYGLQITGGYNHGIPSLTATSAGSVYYAGNIGISSINPWGIYSFTRQWIHYKLGQITAPYYFTGNVMISTLSGSQLLYGSANNRVSVNEGITQSKYHETVLGGSYTISKQAYYYYTLGINYDHIIHPFSLNGNVSLAATYNQGISGDHGTFVQVHGSPKPRFHFMTFNVGYTQSLPLGMTAQFTAGGQWATNTMPSNSQYVIGGFGNLSAYYSGVEEGDSGYAGRFNLQSPAAHWGPMTATGSLFVETAGITDHYLYPGQHPWVNLSDMGLGVTMSTPWGSTISAVSAVPIGHNGLTPAGLTNVTNSRIDAYFVFTQDF